MIHQQFAWSHWYSRMGVDGLYDAPGFDLSTMREVASRSRDSCRSQTVRDDLFSTKRGWTSTCFEIDLLHSKFLKLFLYI